MSIKILFSEIIKHITRGRYTIPKTPVCDRICRTCNVTEDDIHFLLYCVEYGKMRDDFYAKVKNRYVDFIGLNDNGYDTKGSDMELYLPTLRTEVYRNSFMYMGGKL